MSRKRLVAPQFFTNADLYDAEATSGLPLRVCFVGLWTVADRRGIFRWSRNIKPDVLPYDSVDILACLDALERTGFVKSYEVAGRMYGIIPTFPQHQTFHVREKPSADPAPSWLATAQGQPEALTPSLSTENPVPAQGQPSASPTVTVTGTGTVAGTGTVSTATTPPPAEPPPEVRKAVNWPASVAAAWSAQVGPLSYGQVGKRLEMFAKQCDSPAHAEQAVLAAVANFSRHRRLALARGDAKPDNWPQFVRDLLDYVPADLKPKAVAA